MKPTHRDDLDPEVLEALQKQFPGMKLVCVGDLPEDQVPLEIAQAQKELTDRVDRSIFLGTCLDCGAQMPGYPAPDDAEFPSDWQPAEGWKAFSQVGTEEPAGWQCPACDQKERGDD